MIPKPIAVTISPKQIVPIKPTFAHFLTEMKSFPPKYLAVITPHPTPNPTAISKKTTVIG